MSLISAADLRARVAAGDRRLRIADVRWYLGKPGAGRAAFGAGHLPGAVFIDLERDLAGPGGGRHPLPDPAEFARRLAALGIGADHDVVAYDDQGGAIAARLWWMLDDLGHPSASVLDGGLRAWSEAGGALTTETVTWPPAELRLADRWNRVVDIDGLRDRLDSVVLLDARAGERYRGEVEPVDPVAGHIPGAVSAPAGGNLGPDGRFRPPHELRTRFAALGCASDDAGGVVTSCGSGVTACHQALAMRIAGLPPPVLYAGSFSEWSSSGAPVAVGAEPGSVRAS